MPSANLLIKIIRIEVIFTLTINTNNSWSLFLSKLISSKSPLEFEMFKNALFPNYLKKCSRTLVITTCNVSSALTIIPLKCLLMTHYKLGEVVRDFFNFYGFIFQICARTYPILYCFFVASYINVVEMLVVKARWVFNPH